MPVLPRGDAAAAVEWPMPLGARHLVLIRGVSVIAGLLAVRYVLGGLVLGTAGMATLGVALSYRDGKRWF